MKIKAIMMQKNEDVLLDVWAAYHANLLGYQNLYIYDNGSTLPAVLKSLRRLTKKGANVFMEHNTHEDFANKGPIIAERIHILDESDPADFYFPLDCDEFLMVSPMKTDTGFDRETLVKTLMPYRNSPDILMIEAGYDNLPHRKGFYARKGRGKCFFARNACATLDLGFHRGTAKKSTTRVVTDIAQVHMHYKPFEVLKAHARQKMEGRVTDFSPETLEKHREARGKGVHLITEMQLEDEANYYAFVEQRFAKAKILELPAFAEKLAASGVSLPY